MNRIKWIILALIVGGCAHAPTTPSNFPIQRSDAEWRASLAPESYHVLRQAGTERPHTGQYAKNHDAGDYLCAGCANPLFASESKFESGTGWPSFFQPLKAGAVVERSDSTLGVTRTEVLCSQCGGHLGHVFPDGPRPTGLRYCMNSAALKFVERKPSPPGEGKSPGNTPTPSRLEETL